MSETKSEINEMTAIIVNKAKEKLDEALQTQDAEKVDKALEEITEMILTHINTCIELDKLKQLKQ